MYGPIGSAFCIHFTHPLPLDCKSIQSEKKGRNGGAFGLGPGHSQLVKIDLPLAASAASKGITQPSDPSVSPYIQSFSSI